MKKPLPLFKFGQCIIGDHYMGRIQGAFYADGEWHYLIGNNASILTNFNNEGYDIGPKFISEGSIQHWWDGQNWVEVHERQ